MTDKELAEKIRKNLAYLKGLYKDDDIKEIVKIMKEEAKNGQ
jgi:hypothetical protein